MTRYGYVYLTTNLINGRKYIGQHKSQELNESYLGSGSILTQAIALYGFDKFKVEPIEFCSSKEELDCREIHWIAHFDAVASPEFYNIQPGGKTNDSAKMAEYSKMAWDNPEMRKHLTESRTRNITARWADPVERAKLLEGIAADAPKRSGRAKTMWQSSSHREKLAKMKWFHNETTGANIKAELCPEGFRPGRKFQVTEKFKAARKLVNERNSNSIWIYNPETKERIRLSNNEKLPSGFIPGRGKNDIHNRK